MLLVAVNILLMKFVTRLLLYTKGYIHVAEIQATCCRQHVAGKHVAWCKRGFRNPTWQDRSKCNPCTYTEVKSSKFKVTRPANAEIEKMRHIFRMGNPTNFRLGTHIEHEDPYHRQAT